MKGSEKNDWEGVFGEFSDKIQQKIGNEMHQLIVSDFSTTTPLSKVILFSEKKKNNNWEKIIL